MPASTQTRWCLVTLLCVAAATGGAAASRPPSQLPSLLSDTGLYSDAGALVVDGRNLAFTPQYPLWTDGATKRRWIGVPHGRTIDARRIDAWQFPVGTRFWKEFSFDGRRIETRMLLKTTASRWEFASYVWNEAQTDATLAPAAGVARAVEIAPGRWHAIPSVDECRACHDSDRTEPLGFTALQLSDDRDPLAVHGETPDEEDITFRRLLETGVLRNVAAAQRTIDPAIPASSPRERAVLGYLSSNCGACHNGGGPLAALGLSFRQPAYGGGLHIVARGGLDRRTKWDRPGAPPETTRVVDTDALELSALLIRMKSRRPTSQMPPLGTVVVDHEAVSLVSDWIRDELTLIGRANAAPVQPAGTRHRRPSARLDTSATAGHP